MASTYSTSLKIQLIANGEQSNIWGTTTNTNWNLVEQAIAGVATITMSNANYTLSNLNGVSDEARNMVLVVNGTNSAIRQIIAPLAAKVYTVFNNTTGGYAITIGGASGTTVSIPNGITTTVYCDGTNFYTGISGTPGTFTAGTFSGAGTGLTGIASGLSIGGNSATTSQTNFTNLTINTSQVLAASNYNTYAPSLTGTGATGTWNIDISGNAATATSATSATSATTATNLAGGGAGQVPYNTGSGATAFLAAGTSGQVLTSNGTSAPSWQTVSSGGGTTAYALTMDNSGSGAASGTTFNGSTARTISYNTVGAPSVTGTGASGTWGINISGNAATATSATSATTASTAGTATNLSGGSVAATTITATGNITAYYSSDVRLKENVKDVENPLGIVCAIGSKTYDWTQEYLDAAGGEDDYFIPKQSFGVIAQDVQAVFPQAVRTRKDGTLAVDYEKLSTLAFGAIKQLLARVEALEAK